VRAETYSLIDSTTGQVLFDQGRDFAGVGNGPTAAGLLPIVMTDSLVRIDTANSTWAAPPTTNADLKVSYQPVLSPNLRRPGYPEDLEIRFASTVKDTGLAVFPAPARPAKFEIFALEPAGPRKMDFVFRDADNNQQLSRLDERIDIVTYAGFAPTSPQITWRVELDTTGIAPNPLILPTDGDVWRIRLVKPLSVDDVFVFTTSGNKIAGATAGVPNQPYVVPNPYLGAASFEPSRFATSGRGVRRVEFRGVPQNATVRIYTVRGELVQTLRHDGSLDAMVPWDLRSKDNLDIAPGLYIFQVEAPGASPTVGKFAVVK
jgi:hypothetical protein